MKLYTRPRPLHLWQLRPGDQIATFKDGGDLVRSETAYVDADLTGGVAWSVVHMTADRTAEHSAAGRPWTEVIHTLGSHTYESGRSVIAREVIEIDPWTYVNRNESENP